MNTYVYGDDGKALIRLDPRTKLLIFLISGTVSLNCYKPVPSTSGKSIKILCKLACKRIYYLLTRKKYE